MTELPLLEELTAVACQRHLQQTELGRVALLVDGHPEIFPVNYTVGPDGEIYFRTDPGAKLGALRHAETIAFEIDGYDDESHGGWSVLMVGEAYRVAAPDLLDLVERSGLRPWPAGEKTHVVRISPIKVTGRYLPHSRSG